MNAFDEQCHEPMVAQYDAETGMAPCGVCGRWVTARAQASEACTKEEVR